MEVHIDTLEPVPEAPEQLLVLPEVEDAVLVEVEEPVQALEVVEVVVVDAKLLLWMAVKGSHWNSTEMCSLKLSWKRLLRILHTQ